MFNILRRDFSSRCLIYTKEKIDVDLRTAVLPLCLVVRRGPPVRPERPFVSEMSRTLGPYHISEELSDGVTCKQLPSQILLYTLEKGNTPTKV